MIIYCITNKLNGKRYIGQTIHSIKDRMKRHRTSPYAIGKAIRKYGEKSFETEILFRGFTRCILNTAEIQLIKNYNTMYPNGYNLMEGGHIKLSKQSIEKMKKSKTGVKQSPEAISNRIKSLKKPVLCIEDEICFLSVTDAGDYYNISPSHITKVCKGKLNKTRNRTFKHLTGGGLFHF